MKLDIQTDAVLDDLSTFRLPARTTECVYLTAPAQLQAALDTPLPVLILGGGSNTLFVDDYRGRVIVNRLRGMAFETQDDQNVLVTVAAGEDWHAFVLNTLEKGLWGLENLALIPGSVGAAPMQNIGAYGVELSDCLDSVQVFDRTNSSVQWLTAEECQLGYRDSRFKSADAGRFIILAVRLRLSMQPKPELRYPALQEELARQHPTHPEHPRIVAQAVMRIRQRKLPDPADIPNAGSFFKNPIISTQQAQTLLRTHPDLPNWPSGDQTKLSAAWLIDQLGWRGKSVGDTQVYPKHALVLTNRGQASGEDLLKLAGCIRQDVHEHYGIELEHEPQLIGGKP